MSGLNPCPEDWDDDYCKLWREHQALAERASSYFKRIAELEEKLEVSLVMEQSQAAALIEMAEKALKERAPFSPTP